MNSFSSTDKKRHWSTKKWVQEAKNEFLDYIKETTKGCNRAPMRTIAQVSCSNSNWDRIGMLPAIAMTQAAYEISQKHFPFRLSDVEASFEIGFNETQSDDIAFRVLSCGDTRDSDRIVIDSGQTRKNRADGSVEGYFNNHDDLHDMGLRTKVTDKEIFLDIIWQFDGRAQEDTRETIAFNIAGGDRDYIFENNKSKRYALMRWQDKFTLKGKGGDTDRNISTISIDSEKIEGNILTGRFINGQWEYRIHKNVVIDGERIFANTEGILERPISLTVDGLTIAIEPIAAPEKRRKHFFGL